MSENNELEEYGNLLMSLNWSKLISPKNNVEMDAQKKILHARVKAMGGDRYK